MSSTNTTLATLAGGFVPMLLKNVLSSKGAKLSLKSISFKGQIDEIIDEYKQFWPVLDLTVEKDEPQVEEGKQNGAEGGDETSDVADAKSGHDDISIPTNGKQEGFEIEDIGAKNSTPKDGSVSGDAPITTEPKTEEDDGKVDLFIDLSVADTAGEWSLHGSLESVNIEQGSTFSASRKQKRTNSMMPPYFDPEKINGDATSPEETVMYKADPPPYSSLSQ